MSKAVDILLVTESHLTPQISTAAVSISGFQIFRNDSGRTAKHGVCTFVRDGIEVDEVNTLHPNVLSFRLAMFNVYVIVVYRPPSYSQEQNDALAAFLLSSCSGKEALLIGDFNLPSLDWLNPQMLRSAQGWQVVAKVVFTTGFNRLKPAGKNSWWQKVAKSGKKSNEDNLPNFTSPSHQWSI